MFRGMQERMLFLYKFLQAPGLTGNGFPSSGQLAKALLDPVPWDRVNLLAELGAGTGAITRHLPSEQQSMQVLLFEKDQELRQRLKRQFPGYLCYPDSSRLRLALHNEKLEKLDCIVSGLPFWSMRRWKRQQMLAQIASSLKDEGMFVVFSYFAQMKKDLRQFFEIQSATLVPMNFPPAMVYVCRKKADTAAGGRNPGWLSVVSAQKSQVLLER